MTLIGLKFTGQNWREKKNLLTGCTSKPELTDCTVLSQINYPWLHLHVMQQSSTREDICSTVVRTQFQLHKSKSAAHAFEGLDYIAHKRNIQLATCLAKRRSFFRGGHTWRHYQPMLFRDYRCSALIGGITILRPDYSKLTWRESVKGKTLVRLLCIPSDPACNRIIPHV